MITKVFPKSIQVKNNTQSWPYRLALGMKLQKEVISDQKQPSCKKSVWPLKKARVKKDVKSKVAAKKWL